jgi:asparagine synthetase B (glutamine-hydrolysing)
MWQFKKTFLGKKKQIDIRSVRDYLCKGFYSLPYTLFEGYFRFVHVCGDQNEFYEPIEKIFPDILYAQNPQRKFALHFSGGYDSSLLAKIYDRDDADFMHLIGPETAKARVLAEGLKGRMREFSVNADDFIKAADEVTSNIEEPYAYNDVVFTYLLSKYARDFGHDLVITGDGGDYVFGGINVGINSALSSDIWKTLDPNTLLGLRSFQPLMHSALKSWADATLRPSEVTIFKKIFC